MNVRAAITVALLIGLAACSSATATRSAPSTVPTTVEPDLQPGNLLFARTTATQVHIAANHVLMNQGCINQLFAQFSQAGQQTASISGLVARPDKNQVLQTQAVGADWLTAYAGTGVANVRFTDSAGHRDEMRPVQGWVALAGTLTETPVTMTLTAYSASGKQLALLDVKPTGLQLPSITPCP